jgi:flagellar biogenesis protein FliO
MLAVFVLLLLFLRFLGRFHRGQKHSEASLLEVWPLGPRREIQLIRLRDRIHYVYRHEGALVLLDQEAFATYRVTHPSRSQRSPVAWAKLLNRLGIVSHSVSSSPANSAESTDLAGDRSRG